MKLRHFVTGALCVLSSLIGRGAEPLLSVGEIVFVEGNAKSVELELSEPADGTYTVLVGSGLMDGGETTNGWGSVRTVGFLSSGEDRVSFMVPSAWNAAGQTARFFLVKGIVGPTPVEYVEGTGPQQLDLGFSMCDTYTIDVTLMYTRLGGSSFIGAPTSPDSNDFRFFLYNNTPYLDFPSNKRINGGRFELNEVRRLRIGNYYLRDLDTDTNLLTGTPYTFAPHAYPVRLFTNSDYGRVYSIRVFNGDDLLYDFIPCVSDDVPGLFESVHNTFHTNIGSGELLVGAALASEGEAEVVGVTDTFTLAPPVVATPTLEAVAGEAAPLFSVTLLSGEDVDLWAIYTDTATGVAITNTLGNGVSGPLTLTDSPTALLPGTRYTYAVRAENAYGMRLRAGETPFTPFGASSTRYVATTGSDDNDGLSLETPLATLGAALQALESQATPGGTIFMVPGAYPQSGTHYLTNAPIAIVGLTGQPEDVVLYRDPSRGNFRLFTIAEEEACLRHVTISNGNFRNGTGQSGGNVQIFAPGGTLEHCILTHGDLTATWGGYGGNLYLNAGRVVRCKILHGISNANGNGGGNIHMDGGLLESCFIAHGSNQANGISAGGVHLKNDALLRNCTIVENQSSRAGALHFGSTTARAINCVVYGNVTTSSSYANDCVYVPETASTQLLNCLADTTTLPNSSCFQTVFGFADAPSGDYHLLGVSEAVDHGAPTELISPLDLDGNPRIAFGGIDIGCYELQTRALTAAFYASVQRGKAPLETTFTASTTDATGDVLYTWDFGDGSEPETTSSPSLTHTYALPGTYAVSLVVQDALTSTTCREPDYIQAIPETLYVAEGNPHAAIPYASEDTAAATIADAISVAVEGCTVAILPGSYVTATTHLVTKGISVIGTTSNPNDVLVQCPNNRAFLVKHPNALVANLTIHDCRVTMDHDGGGGLRIDPEGGTVSNCVIRGCAMDNWGAIGGGASIRGGLLTHSIITGSCSTRGTGGRAYGVALYIADGGTVENCLITEQNADPTIAAEVIHAYGTIRNCTLVNERVRNGVAGLYAQPGASVVNVAIANVFACETTTTTEIVDDQEITTTNDYANPTPAPWDGSANAFSHCATDGTAPINDSCILGSADEFFTNPQAADYTLPPSSPLAQAGCLYENLAPSDLAGNPRLAGRFPDIGCYELQFLPRTIILLK